MGGVPSLFRIARHGATVKEGTTDEELVRFLERAKDNVSSMKLETVGVMILQLLLLPIPFAFGLASFAQAMAAFDIVTGVDTADLAICTAIVQVGAVVNASGDVSTLKAICILCVTAAIMLVTFPRIVYKTAVKVFSYEVTRRSSVNR